MFHAYVMIPCYKINVHIFGFGTIVHILVLNKRKEKANKWDEKGGT